MFLVPFIVLNCKVNNCYRKKNKPENIVSQTDANLFLKDIIEKLSSVLGFCNYNQTIINCINE